MFGGGKELHKGGNNERDKDGDDGAVGGGKSMGRRAMAAERDRAAWISQYN